MNLRDLLRTAVLATNPYWPFAAINKLPYSIAVQRLVRLCAAHGLIKSVYLRSGLVERAWVPGISDIDFTIVIDGRASLGEQLAFLQRFWAQFDQLKSYFPMIGEVDVLTDATVKSWSRFGLAGHSTRHWKLLHGFPTAQSVCPFNAQWFGRDCIDYALNYFYWYSRGYFEGRFYGNPEAAHLLDQDLRRLAGKIFRCLDHVNPLAVAKDRRWLESCPEPDLFARVVNALERTSASAIGDDKGETQDSAWAEEFSRELPPVRTAQETVNAAVFAPWKNLIEGVLLDFNNRMYIVFRNDQEVSAIAACIGELKETLASSGAIVTVTSASLFAYMLGHYQPIEHLYLLRHRKLICGSDVVQRLAPPSRSAYARFILNQLPNALVFPNSRSFHSTPNANELASLLERALFARLYLEHHVVAATPEKLLGECQRYYPELANLVQGFRSQTLHHAPNQRFDAFKRLADTISTALEHFDQQPVSSA